MLFQVDTTERLTMEKLQTSKGLTDNQLDQELDIASLPVLAQLFNKAKHYVGKFELTRSEITDVEDERTTQNAMQKALYLWHKKNPTVATYRKLLEIILTLNEGAIAFQVCDFISKP